MKGSELNTLPEKLRQGSLTEKEVIGNISCFVVKNYPVFGLQKYDEDFRQNILLKLVEKGSHILRLYNPESGDFFTFLYCYICTLINSEIKKIAAEKIKEKLNINECILEFEDTAFKYTQIDYKSLELPKVPYACKKIDPKEFQQTINSLSLNQNDKAILILALKSSFFLTDEQIRRICRIYNINKEYFYNLIQYCKNSIFKKTQRRTIAIERRNYAYYHHKRCKTIIDWIDEDIIPAQQKLFKERLAAKEVRHRKNWNRLNDSFEKGYLYLRPSTRTVANLMGICERQVNYYIHSVRKNPQLKKADDCL